MSREAPWIDDYFSTHYLAIYAQRLIRPMETGWEASFVPKALGLKAGSRLLDCPCGFGRHLHRMRLAGYRVVGADIKPLFLEYALRSSHSSRFESPPLAAADMARLPFADESFDGAACLFNSFGYFPDDTNPDDGAKTNLDVLREYARVLRPGGGFLLDIPNREDLVDMIETSPRTRCGGEDWEIRERWRFDHDTRRLHNETQFEYQGATRECGYEMRLYSRQEIEDDLRATGLAPRKFWSDLHRDADANSGDRLVIASFKED